jgi:hypothetical protein
MVPSRMEAFYAPWLLFTSSSTAVGDPERPNGQHAIADPLTLPHQKAEGVPSRLEIHPPQQVFSKEMQGYVTDDHIQTANDKWG